MIFIAYISIALELVVGYIALFIIAKIIGKTLINQLTPFDFICAIILSELVGNALYEPEINVLHIIFSITIWGLLIYATEWITQKFRPTRNFLEGKPSIVIDKGNLSYSELKKNHIDLNQLEQLLRSKGVFTMREVEYAILEADGTLNVLKKPIYDIATRKDENYPESEAYMAIPLITDGEIIDSNLMKLGFSKKWLCDELSKLGHLRPDEVLYAEWLEGDGLFVQKY